VTVLFATHPVYLEHLAGPRHPERPERLDAVLEGIRRADLDEAMTELEPRPAQREDLLRVHPEWYLDRIEAICDGGGGRHHDRADYVDAPVETVFATEKGVAR